jgi:hypothetical protein
MLMQLLFTTAVIGSCTHPFVVPLVLALRAGHRQRVADLVALSIICRVTQNSVQVQDIVSNKQRYMHDLQYLVTHPC